jgi:hypothetical protein
VLEKFGELEKLNTWKNSLWIYRFSSCHAGTFTEKCRSLQMNLVKAFKRMTYGEVVLPGKKSKKILKAEANCRAKVNVSKRIP